MPIYEWLCPECGHKEDVICRVEERDAFSPEHKHRMKRIIGPVAASLYFEEGRGRYIEAFGETVTSPAQEARLMRQHGVQHAGDRVPDAIRRNPASIAMKRHLEKDRKGRWI